jgi:hypothetical protein
VLVSVFILLSLVFVCGIVVTIVISSTALNTKSVTDPLELETTKTTATTTTIRPKLINICADKSSRWVDIKEIKNSSFFPQYSLVYEKTIRAMVEICIPEIHYIIHFDDEIVLIEDKNFKKVDTFKTKFGKQNIDKLRIVATKDKIILTDNTDYLHIYNLDMQSSKSENINDGLSPIKLGAMFYDSVQDKLLVHEVSKGIRVVEIENLKIKKYLLPLTTSENIFFQKVGNDFIFLTSVSGALEKYDITNNKSSDQNIFLCSNQNVVAFFVKSNYNILVVCSAVIEKDKTYSKLREYEYILNSSQSYNMSSSFKAELDPKCVLINKKNKLLITNAAKEGKSEFMCCTLNLQEDSDDSSNGRQVNSSTTNTCINNPTRLSNFISNQNSIQQNTFTFESEILAVVEICTPEVFYILHFGNKIMKIDKNFFKIISAEYKGKDNKIQMLASKTMIIVIDGSDYFCAYNFDLELISNSSHSREYEPFNYKKMCYDWYNDQFIVHNPYRGFYFFDMNARSKTIYLKLSESILFYKTAEFIYIAMSNNSLGRIDILNKMLSMQEPLCCNDKSVVGIIADENDTLLTVYSNEESSDIIISRFGNKAIQKVENIDYSIREVFIDSQGKLIASFNNSNATGLLLLTNLSSPALITREEVYPVRNKCPYNHRWSKNLEYQKLNQLNNDKPITIAEICIPDSRYILLARKQIIMINSTTLEIIKYKKNGWTYEKDVRMVATKNQILVLDMSAYIDIYSLDLNYIRFIKIDGLYDHKEIYYDAIGDRVLVQKVDYGIYFIDEFFKIVDTIPLKINEKIFFQKTPQNFIYYALEDGTIGKYNIKNETNVPKSGVCSKNSKVVAFHYDDEEDLLLTVCSNTNLSEIIVSNFESSTPIKSVQIKNYGAANMIVSKEGQLVFVGSTINFCVDKSDSFDKFIQIFIQLEKDVSPKILKKINSEVYAVVEVCIPSVIYILLLKDRLVSIDANTLEQINESERFDFSLKLDKIKMIATNFDILLADGSDIIRRYNFDLKYDTDISCTECVFGAIFYDHTTDEILLDIFSYSIQAYTFDIDFRREYSINLNDDILFYKTVNFIYFIMTNSTIGKYDILDEEYELSSQMCSAGAKVITFQANEDETLLAVCTQNSTTEIILSNYRDEKPTKTMLLDQKDK